MIALLTLSLVVPLFALAWVAITRRPTRAEWPVYLRRIGAIFGIGLFAAMPFLTSRGLGTSEAYNYSLSVADAVTQFRHGTIPVLVGQSEFAFNGRIHPLRTAPYLAHLAGLIDAITLRSLNFWALQNLCLALSLIAAAFSMYSCLRRSSSCRPNVAIGLTAGYLLSPGVLAAAYGMDLYMTVMATPFVPAVVAANALAWRGQRGFGTYAQLAAALAACWWAHPPVAWWMTCVTGLAQLPLVLTGRIHRPEWKGIAAAGALGLALAGFVFYSSLSITSYNAMAAARAQEAIVEIIRSSFRASLRPISATAAELGDFQLGYAYWGLFFICFTTAAVRRNVCALVFAVCGALALALTIPVPGVTAGLWRMVPTFALTMNGPWPMQRLYLIATALILMAAAQLDRGSELPKAPKFVRDTIGLLLAAAVLWTGYQATRFVFRGLSSRMDVASSRAAHASENLNLTLIAYAMLTPPPTFTNGVMDATMDLRVLRRADATELVNNMKAVEAWGPIVRQGTFSSSGSEGEIAVLTPQLQLEPGKRYRLDFNFRSLPIHGILRLIGPHTNRNYPLPQSGESAAFGMGPTNRRGFTIWTTSDQVETVQLQLVGPEFRGSRFLSFADFTLRTYDPEKLPIRLESLVPLRARVHSPEPGYLETPRVFLKGYRAKVNGQEVRAPKSPDGLVMAPIPAGESLVEIDYPGPPGLKLAFWISVAGWLGLFLANSIFVFKPQLRTAAGGVVRKAAHALWQIKLALAIACVVVAVASWGWMKWSFYRDAAGPLRLVMVFPRGEIGRSQPLVTTGHANAGTFIFAIYQDATHIRVGMDVWGVSYWVSEPLPFDYFAEHEFIINSGALYPLGHPKLKELSSAQLEALRKRITVQLDGRVVLDQPVFSFDSKISEVTVGESRIGVSSTEPKFTGQILKAERLPIPDSR